MRKSKKITIKYIEQHLKKLNALSDSVANLLQIDRNIHTLWVSIEKNKLFLMTDDSLFASRLRFQQDIVRQYLNKKLLIKLESVKIKIIAKQTQPREPRKEKRFQILPQTATILAGIAEGIEDDEIRASLKRLGRQ